MSEASESSDLSSSYSDLSPQPASTTVTVIGTGLLQVSPADLLIRRYSLGSDESKMSTGEDWETGADDLYKLRHRWNSREEAVTEQDCEDLTDEDGHPGHLVQLQNILPLFVFGTNSDGSRSVQLAAIGDQKLKSEYLLSLRRTTLDSSTVSNNTADEADNLPRSSHLLPKSTSGQVSELTNVTVNNDNKPYFLYSLLKMLLC